MGKALNRYFAKKYVQMTNKYMKILSTSFATRGLKIKTAVKYHYVPIRMIKTKKLTIPYSKS